MKRIFRLSIFTLLVALPFLTLQAAEGDEITVVYNGSTADVTIPSGIRSMVSATVDGADVVITSSTTSEEYVYTVSGNTSNGSLLINGGYKLTLKLAGTSIHSDKGAAIDVECGKRIAVVLQDGTVNELSDCTGGLQKAAMYFSGHPEFEGAGTLNVTGNSKHAISAKEYLQLKKSVGVINVLGAVSDGIHCGRGKVNNENNFFQINGGTVNISNVGGDCIDSDDFGSMLLKGGELNLIVGDGGKGLKCDSVLTMVDGTVNIYVPGQDAEGIRTCYSADFQGGTITMTVKGNGSKGIKAKEDNETVMNGGYATFSGTNVDITASGADYIDAETGDASKCMCISIDKDMAQTAGEITLTVEGHSAKAYNVKGELSRTGGTLIVNSDAGYSVNPYDFQYDMTAYVAVTIEEVPLLDYSTYQLGAFCGSTCCGVASVQQVGDKTYAYLRVYSNEPGADISFRLLDVVSGKEQTSATHITFQPDGAVGTPSSPFVLAFGAKEFNVSVSSADELMGTVTGGGTFELGQEVTVVATPNEFYYFVGWLKNGALVSDEASYTFTVEGDVELKAVFNTSYDFIPDAASTERTGGEDYTKAFDDDLSTKWGFVFSHDTYVIFHPTSNIVANSYGFTTANDNEKHWGRNPYSWIVFGSNSESVPSADSETWEQIAYVGEDIVMEDKNFTTYTFPLSVQGNTYRYYMLVIRSLAGANFCQFSEFFISSDVVAPIEQEGDYIVDASSSRIGASEGVVRAFDGREDTKWAFGFSSPSYVIFHPKAETVDVNSYTIVTGNDNEEYPGRNPKSWTLYACDATACPSAESELWQPIASVTDDATLEDKNLTSYTFPLDVEHCTSRYYMLVISEIQGDGYFQMSEFSLGWNQDIEDGVSGVAAASVVSEIYTLDGMRTTQLLHGVNIVRKSDGTVTKIVRR